MHLGIGELHCNVCPPETNITSTEGNICYHLRQNLHRKLWNTLQEVVICGYMSVRMLLAHSCDIFVCVVFGFFPNVLYNTIIVSLALFPSRLLSSIYFQLFVEI